MYLSTPTSTILLQKPVKIFTQKSAWKPAGLPSSLQGGSVAGEYGHHYYSITMKPLRNFPAMEMAEVIMSFLKVTGLQENMAQALKTQ